MCSWCVSGQLVRVHHGGAHDGLVCPQPLAKLFKYAGWETLQNATFVVFTLTWIVTRHGIFFIFYHSAWTHPFRLLTAEEHWDPANGAFYTPNVIYAFLVVLTAFQLLLLFWLSLLIKAVKKALTVRLFGAGGGCCSAISV